MSRLTNPLTRSLAVATFLGAVALVGPAYAASTTDQQAATPVAAASPVTHDRGVETRINRLHAKLHITAAQEPQWAIVAQAMRDNAKNMVALITERSANAKVMTAMDDLRSYEKLAAAHEDGLKAFIPVFQTLYDSMSDDQKKVADAAFRNHGSHEKHRKV